MIKYPKIQSVFKRDPKTHKFIIGEYSTPEFEYLKDCIWIGTEKIDGTNIRVEFRFDYPTLTTSWKDYTPVVGIGVNPEISGKVDISLVKYGGRTDNAQIYAPLLNRLKEIFEPKNNCETFIQFKQANSVILFGEGYGNKIQKNGHLYKPNGVDFILFDVLVDYKWWLKRDALEETAQFFNIKIVPVICEWDLYEITENFAYSCDQHLSIGNLDSYILPIRQMKSVVAETPQTPMEGLVLKPKIDLYDRNNKRIITKIKYKDFSNKE